MNEAEYLEKAKSIILEKARPEKIVLFGSRARGGYVQDSDFDLLIIVKDGANPLVERFEAIELPVS
jgi:predicted nucleotidyltransferase